MEMISKRDLVEIFAWCERELKGMMNDIPNAEGTIDLVFWALDKMIFPQERKWEKIDGGEKDGAKSIDSRKQRNRKECEPSKL